MGQYGYAEIEIIYKDNTKEEDKQKFIQAVDDHEEIENVNASDFEYFEIHSDRLQNLDYQCQKVCEVASNYGCVEEIIFAGYAEYQINAGYHYEDKEE